MIAEITECRWSRTSKRCTNQVTVTSTSWPQACARLIIDHLLYAVALGGELATAPAKILGDWARSKFPVPGQNFLYAAPQSPGERSRLPPRHVRRERYRRDAWQASKVRRTARGRRSLVWGLISTLLHPRAWRASHRTRPGTWLSAQAADKNSTQGGNRWRRL